MRSSRREIYWFITFRCGEQSYTPRNTWTGRWRSVNSLSRWNERYKFLAHVIGLYLSRAITFDREIISETKCNHPPSVHITEWYVATLLFNFEWHRISQSIWMIRKTHSEIWSFRSSKLEATPHAQTQFMEHDFIFNEKWTHILWRGEREREGESCVLPSHSYYNSFYECHETHERYARTLLMHESIAQFKYPAKHTLDSTRLELYTSHIPHYIGMELCNVHCSSLFSSLYFWPNM